MTPIEEQVAARRAALGSERFGSGAHRIWGLALSGGGIRSATFCFGLLRALAHNDVLLRVDVLSTVSGGGYIGAMLGRLFSRAANRLEVEKISAAMSEASSRWFEWWLRANGRYLTPRGTKDWTYAVALYIRGLVGIHFEFGLVAALLGILLGWLDLYGWSKAAHWAYATPQEAFTALRYLPPWMPVVAFLEPVVVLIGSAVAFAYWSVPSVVKTRTVAGIAVLALWFLALFIGCVVWRRPPLLPAIGTTVGSAWRVGLAISGCLMVLAWQGAVPIAYAARFLSRHVKTIPPAATTGTQMDPAVAQAADARRAADNLRTQADTMRTRLTRWLAWCFRAAAIVFGLGLIDRMAWFIAFDLESVGHVGVGLGVTAVLLRAVHSKLFSLTPGRPSTAVLLLLGRVLGYVLTFVLCAWWVSLIYAAGLGALFQHAGPNFRDAIKVLAMIGAPIVLYLLITGSNLSFLNLSSLHGFYRARLVRSYLGAANGVRLGQPQGLDAINSLRQPMRESPNLIAVGDTQIDDDINFVDYAPYRHGGPVHLINMCINQTRDPRGGLFNQDRRGLAFCVASGGMMRVAQFEWKELPSDDMTLGTWTAISGAAVAPGIGSLTRGGISALAFFAGVRLGYWWRRDLPTWIRWLRVHAKSGGVMAETLGIFRGAGKSNWFLTDGGHFENTGAYALLAERAQLVIVADCGADPHYAFCDLENLVRKARIDLQAEIIFQKPKIPARFDTGRSMIERFLGKQRRRPAPDGFANTMALFGSLNDLASDSSTACLALARITYSGRRAGQGFLILIKPNISPGLPVDLINFKAQNPAFPQETTADQWFSEAQWESYSQLGYHLGAKLQQHFIEAVMSTPDIFFEADEQAPFEEAKKGERTPAEGVNPTPTGRLPARIISPTVRAGLGLGAVATVAVSSWQAIEGFRTSHVNRTSDERSALKELTGLWAKVMPRSADDPKESATRALAVEALAATIVRAADALCPVGQEGWFQKSAAALTIYDAALKACGEHAAENPTDACSTLLNAADPRLPGPYPRCLMRYEGVAPAIPAPRYWLYDYSKTAPVALAHPCDDLAAGRRDRSSAACVDPTDIKIASTMATTSSAAAMPGACDGKSIYPLIYGPEQRVSVDGYRQQWTDAGARVTQSEDVVESAWFAGRATPLAVTVTTVRYSDETSTACAQLLNEKAGSRWAVEYVPPQFASIPGVIEVWLQPNH